MHSLPVAGVDGTPAILRGPQGSPMSEQSEATQLLRGPDSDGRRDRKSQVEEKSVCGSEVGCPRARKSSQENLPFAPCFQTRTVMQDYIPCIVPAAPNS